MTALPSDRIAPWETAYTRRLSRARQAAVSLPESDLDALPLDVLIEAVVSDHAAGIIHPRYEAAHARQWESKNQPDDDGLICVGALWLEVLLPCEGAADAMSRGVSTGGRSQGDDHQISITTEVPDDITPEQLTQAKTAWFQRVASATEEANQEIQNHRETMTAAVREILSVRHKRRRALVAATSMADLPLHRLADGPRPLSLQAKRLSLKDVERSAAAGGNEHGLADEIALALIDQARAFARALERAPSTADKLVGQDEETIRDVLLFIFNSQWGGLVTGETFLGAGKTDILLRWRDRDAFIGECKFWRGPSYFDEGVEQLLDRYVIWRATRVALLIFIRDRSDPSAAMHAARDRIRAHDRFIAAVPDQEDTFAMSAQNDRRKIVTVSLIFVVLPRPSPSL